MRPTEYTGFNAEEFTAYMKDFLPTMHFFIDREEKFLAIAEHHINDGKANDKRIMHDIFFSSDQKNFYQFYRRGSGIAGNLIHGKSRIRLDNPHGEKLVEYDLYFDGGIGFMKKKDDTILDHNVYQSVRRFENSNQFIFHPLPYRRSPVFFLEGDNKFQIYIDSNEYHPNFHSMHCYIKKRGVFQKVEVLRYQQFHDGNVTQVYTDAGRLLVIDNLQSEIEPKAIATWTALGEKLPIPLTIHDCNKIDVRYENQFPIIKEFELIK